MTDHLQRFLDVMEYRGTDRLPNWEAGVWPQTRERWTREAPETRRFHWDWFSGEAGLGMDPREFIPFKACMIPPFAEETLSEDGRTRTYRDAEGRVRRSLKEGQVDGIGASMDQYLDFPVHDMEDWLDVKSRYELSPARYGANWECFRPQGWRRRAHPLIFGPNGTTWGFYWFLRELMGTEGASYAFYDQPALVHDMMEFQAEFLIEAARPVLARTTIDYMCLNEDMSMKTGPLLSPKSCRTFILPRLRRVIDFYKSHGVRYVCIDTDGDPEALIPMMLDAGVDALWPLERAAGQDPVRLRRKYGRALRLWGGVDKRVLAEGPAAIDAHLAALRPLVEEGGFIPTIDHTVPPDVSFTSFLYYITSKAKLLGGQL